MIKFLRNYISKVTDRFMSKGSDLNFETDEILQQKPLETSFILTPASIRKRQVILAVTIAGVVIVVLFMALRGQNQPQSRGPGKSSLFGLPSPKTESLATKIETAGDSLKPEEIWRYKISEEGRRLKEQIEELKDALQKAADQPVADSKSTELESKIKQLEALVLSANVNSSAASHIPLERGIQRISLNLAEKKTKTQIDTVDTTIPAGAFAKAVLLSGIDAATALSSSSDPMPILVRITNHGTLPRHFRSDLKDCHIIAGAYGDLSSERVYARLEKLTCTERLTGEIVETEVAGFIAGEDGKVGVRGKVVAKEHAYLAQSLLGGIVGGFSHSLVPQKYTPFISQGTPQGPSTSEKFKTGFGEGVSTSMDRLSKYYIDRAESLQPVIEIAAGRVIDVVFTAKAGIGSTQVKQELAARRDSKRLEAAKQNASQDKFSANLRGDGL